MLTSNLSSKLIAVNRWQANQDHIDQRFFLLTLFAAFLLHITGVYLWSMLPKNEVVDVPVRVLNIKLGDVEIAPAELKAVQPETVGTISTATAVPSMAQEQEKEKKREQKVTASLDKAMSALDQLNTPETAEKIAPVNPAKHSKAVVKGKFNVRSEGTKVAAPVFPVTTQQFVRFNQAQAMADNSAQTSGSPVPLTPAQVVSRYEQLISLWIQKFKTYPSEARKQGMQGETIVRIRIDRQGNILYYVLEHSTGYPLLDHAAIDMIRHANPVPALPANYPPGELMEFLIPVSFHLEP